MINVNIIINDIERIIFKTICTLVTHIGTVLFLFSIIAAHINILCNRIPFMFYVYHIIIVIFEQLYLMKMWCIPSAPLANPSNTSLLELSYKFTQFDCYFIRQSPCIDLRLSFFHSWTGYFFLGPLNSAPQPVIRLSLLMDKNVSLPNSVF